MVNWINVVCIVFILAITGITIAVLVRQNDILDHVQQTQKHVKSVEDEYKTNHDNNAREVSMNTSEKLNFVMSKITELETAQKESWTKIQQATEKSMKQVRNSIMHNSLFLDDLGDVKDDIKVQANPFARDQFIADFISTIEKEAKVIDVSAGNKPYEKLFQQVGCQYFSHEFEGNQDILDTFRDEKTKDPQRHDYTGDITHLNIPSAEFDYVFCTEVFEHVPNPIQAMSELVRICKPGGSIVVTAPFTSGSHQQPYHFYAGFSPEWYEYVAAENNLTVRRIASQGDFFKLMQQFSNQSLYYTLDNSDQDTVHKLSKFMQNYYLHLSEKYGDASETPEHIANMFTVGFCVIFDKPAVVEQ